MTRLQRINFRKAIKLNPAMIEAHKASFPIMIQLDTIYNALQRLFKREDDQIYLLKGGEIF